LKGNIFNFGIVSLIMSLSAAGTLVILKQILKYENKKGESLCK